MFYAVVLCPTFVWGEFLVIIFPNVSSVLLSYPCGIPATHITHLVVKSLNICCFFSVFVLSAFQFWKFLLWCLLAQISFFSCVHTTNKPTKAYSFLSQWFWSPGFLSDSEDPCLHCASFLLAVLSTKGLSTLIIAILNTWSNNSNMPVMSLSNSSFSKSDHVIFSQ